MDELLEKEIKYKETLLGVYIRPLEDLKNKRQDVRGDTQLTA